MSVRIVDDNTVVGGSTITTLIEGKARFEDLTFYATPSSTNVPFEIVVSSIENEVVSTALGLHGDFPDTKRIIMSFRHCLAGEILI